MNPKTNIPSSAEIQSMPASPELDALVARALGCGAIRDSVDHPYYCMCPHLPHGDTYVLKQYSRDLRWVGEMLVGLAEQEPTFSIGPFYKTPWLVSSPFDNNRIIAGDDSLPLAAARALAVAWTQTQEVTE